MLALYHCRVTDHSIVKQESQERRSHSNTIMMVSHPLHAILIHRIVEDPPVVSVDQQLRHDVAGELGMSYPSRRASAMFDFNSRKTMCRRPSNDG